VGVAQERALAWTATKTQRGRWVRFAFRRKAVCVNHYYFYLIDRTGGRPSSRCVATPPTRSSSA
jgi:hypothetical protein